MGAGAFIEPLVVVSLLFGGTWINRNTSYRMTRTNRSAQGSPRTSTDVEDAPASPSSTDGLLHSGEFRASSPSLLPSLEQPWHQREIGLFGFKSKVKSPNTRVFKNRLLSRLLQKLPFLVEAWYWALIYWVYQIGRAITAVTLDENTVDVARKHALQVIHLEQKLHIFIERPIQRWFLAHPLLMIWTNRIYSFIHIPGTILFLVWLYYYTTTSNRVDLSREGRNASEVHVSTAGPRLYEARRRTMAVCNLIAFIVFTLWPCMPPRLLSDKEVKGPIGEEARSYGFVDTVHGEGGESSVWTQNKFCNQYAAMPSLHFGYSLLIGLTIMSIPLSPCQSSSRRIKLPIGAAGVSVNLRAPRRLLCLLLGAAYPTIILLAIIATANHFVLDAVAGAIVCGVAWSSNRILLNLLPVEDYFLWVVGIHKPEQDILEVVESESDEGFVIGKGYTVR